MRTGQVENVPSVPVACPRRFPSLPRRFRRFVPVASSVPVAPKNGCTTSQGVSATEKEVLIVAGARRTGKEKGQNSDVLTVWDRLVYPQIFSERIPHYSAKLNYFAEGFIKSLWIMVGTDFFSNLRRQSSVFVDGVYDRSFTRQSSK